MRVNSHSGLFFMRFQLLQSTLTASLMESTLNQPADIGLDSASIRLLRGEQ